MKIPLDRSAAEPIYLQIRSHITRLIQSGALQAGQRLPSIRSLAENSQVNKLTVIEAYSALEGEGLIVARQGAGYFVQGLLPSVKLSSSFAPAQDVIIPEQKKMSPFFESYHASLQAREQGDMIDFTSGFPSRMGLEDLKRIARRAMAQVTDTLFNYDYPQGQLMLRRQITQMLLQLGLEVSPEHLIITNGSKQGLSLACHYYLKPGDWVIVESPTYHGAIALLEDLGARVIGIPMTAEGMNLDLLSQYLDSHRPRLIYTISTLHNPTGITTSPSHRQQLLALAEQYECPILEDNAYEGLNFEPVPAPIKASDRSDLVTYAGTFSKTLMPGLRVGYLVVTGQHYRPLVERKLLQDLHGSTVSQAIISEFLASGHYRRHLSHLRQLNCQSYNAMLHALERYFPSEVSWTMPHGGLFLWTHLPAEVDLASVCQAARHQKVLVTSGAPFFPGQGGYSAMRLNFAHAPEQIEQGVAILGNLLKEQLQATRSSAPLPMRVSMSQRPA